MIFFNNQPEARMAVFVYEIAWCATCDCHRTFPHKYFVSFCSFIFTLEIFVYFKIQIQQTRCSKNDVQCFVWPHKNVMGLVLGPIVIQTFLVNMIGSINRSNQRNKWNSSIDMCICMIQADRNHLLDSLENELINKLE